MEPAPARPRSRARIARSAALAWIAASLVAGAASAPRDPGLPPIVFVSRAPGPPGVVPGLGPAGRSLAAGGRLMLRESDGRLRALLPEGRLFDVSDPAVSFDGREVVFAGTVAPDSAWRLFRVPVEGGAPAPLPLDSEPGADDLDPCWIGPRTIVFASTRGGRVSQYARIPVTNLYRWDFGPTPPLPLTFERNGAEEPCPDPRTGNVLFSRWWFNRHHSAGTGALIAVRAGDSLAERANLWHVMTMSAAGGEARIAAGRMDGRRTAMGYQPAVLANGEVIAVYAVHTGLFPRGGAYGLQRLDRGGRRATRVAGAALAGDRPVAYGGAGGLAAPSACAPAPLPDGRVVFAFDPSGRGDFGLAIAGASGQGRQMLLDLPGTLELDPAPVIVRSGAVKRSRGAKRWGGEGAPRDRFMAPDRTMAAQDSFVAPGRTMAAQDSFVARDQRRAKGSAEGSPRDRSVAPDRRQEPTFRYLNHDVFAGRGAPRRARGARIRFFAAHDRPQAEGGDTVVLVREVPVPRNGRVDESRLPANVPMFEQLLDSRGRTIQGPLGPAHVLGLNVGPAGGTAECRGCHVGHSRRR